MFSEDDVREILQLLPPIKEADKLLPSLLLSSGGRGLLTSQHLEDEFESQVTRDSERVSLSHLARSLDVDTDTVLQLVKSHPSLVLLSEDSRSVITKQERDSIQNTLFDGISSGVLSKTTFLRQHNMSVESIDVLLSDLRSDLVDIDGHLSSLTYDKNLADVVSETLHRSLEEMRSIDIDPKLLPGSPPKWYILRILDRVLESPDMAAKFSVEEKSGSVHCIPIQVIQEQCDTVTAKLQSGTLSHLDLDTFRDQYGVLFPHLENMHEHFDSSSEDEVVGGYVVSKTWLLLFVAKSIGELEQTGYVDLAAEIEQTFPESLRSHMRPKAEKAITEGYSAETIRIGDFLLTSTTYDEERNTLLDHATSDAVSQWEQLNGDPTREAKFSLSNIAKSITDSSIGKAMLKERATEKALDEQFWSEIARLEAENEAGFSAFWTERVTLRVAIYSDGLAAVEDQKLRDQLTELFAQYMQKELIPDVLSKGRSQGHVLSRKTRKNTQRLESTLKADGLDVPAILNSLDKFSKKQSIPPTDPAALSATKQTMSSDMIRRMQKQKKSDGPLLFLTLVILLFAKHHSGIVYATGKFAPKLLKQLKSVLDPEQHAQLETWKDAAKSGSLGADDREDMKKMAEA